MATVTGFDLNGPQSGLDETRSYQKGSEIFLAPNATVSATGNFNGQTLTVTSLLDETEMGFADGVSVSGTAIRVGGVRIATVSGDGAHLVFVFNSNATASQVQTLIRNLTFWDDSSNPALSRAITFNLAGTTRTDTVTVIPVNEPALVDLNGAGSGSNGSAAFREQTSLAIAPAATLSDIDSANLASLKATLVARPDGNAVESLTLNAEAASLAAANGLTVTYSATTGILAIAGAASQAAYQSILRGVIYNNTSDNPSTTSRTITVVANDGQSDSLSRSVTLGITRINDAPDLDLNGSGAGVSTAINYRAGDPLTKIALAGTIADIDSANFGAGSLRVAFTENGTTADQLRIVTDSVVTLSGTGTTVRINGISIGTVSGGGNGSDLVISLNTSASVQNVQTLLQHIGYANTSGSPSVLPRQLTFTVNDGDGTANGGQAVDLATATVLYAAATNVSPTLTGDLQASVTRGGSYAITTADLFFTDLDDTASGVVFTAANVVSGTILVNGSAATSFTGQQLAAGQVAFRHDNSAGTSASFSVSVEDGNEDGSAPVAQNFAFAVTPATPVNVAPTLTGDLQASVTRGNSYTITTADLFFTDPDDAATGVTFTASSLVNGTILVNGSAATSFTGQQLAAGQVAFRHDNSAGTSASFSVSVEDGNEDGSAPVAQNFALTVTAPASALSFAGSARGVNANLSTATWSYAPKIMPFGDSITNGDSPDGVDEHGYRGYLWVNLAEQGKLVDMVGPNNNGLIPDADHAGYPGERADDLAPILPNLLSTYSPDAILLMLGTNDVFYEAQAQNSVGIDIKGMLDQVTLQSPSTHVYVSTILPLAGNTAEVNAVNTVIRATVADAIAHGQNVSLVEMPSITVDDLFDGIHPDEQGYVEMAGYWTNAILNGPPLPMQNNAVAAGVTAITGSSQQDMLIGDGQANNLAGGDASDWLRGEGGDDVLRGDGGRDTLIGGSGADTLWGGAQADTFVFASGFGRDVIADFRTGEDVIDLGSLGLTVSNFSTWLQTHAVTSGADTIITIDANNTIELDNVALSALRASDFLFV
jgi:lysophospholipase L1-like esterase